jgi:hypothetical protein
MARDRRLGMVLAALGLVLAFTLYRMWSNTSALPPLSSNGSTEPAASSTRRPPQAGAVAAPDVHLKELDMERPKPALADRNLFRFKPKSVPAPPLAPPTSSVAVVPTVPSGPAQPAQPPPPPPIPLKFIGLIGPTAELPKIAVFSDGKGLPQYGKEGDIILGQFRIVRIGTESIEMSYLDGRGRQTIRLTGS